MSIQIHVIDCCCRNAKSNRWTTTIVIIVQLRNVYLNPLKRCFDFSNKWQKSFTILCSCSSISEMTAILWWYVCADNSSSESRESKQFSNRLLSAEMWFLCINFACWGDGVVKHEYWNKIILKRYQTNYPTTRVNGLTIDATDHN